LFNKLPRGYQLTPEGTELLDHIKQIESTEKIARGSLQKASAPISGNFRNGAPDGLSNFVLPRVVADIQKQHTELDIQILSLPRVFNLSRREVDLAIMVTPPKTGRFVTKKIVDYHLHLAAHRDYLTQNTPINAKADLKAHTTIGYIPDLIFDPSLDHMAEVTPNRAPNLASNSVAVQMRMLDMGGGIGFAHDFALAHFENLQIILHDTASQKRAFYLVRDRDDRASEQANLIAKVLSDGIKAEVKRLEDIVHNKRGRNG
jgi:DNA-binding transcriptional LysR family regulator